MRQRGTAIVIRNGKVLLEPIQKVGDIVEVDDDVVEVG